MKELLRSCLLGWLVLLAAQVHAQPTPFCGTPAPSKERLDAYQRWVKAHRTARTALGPTAFVPVVYTFVRPGSQAGKPLTEVQYAAAFQSLYFLEKFYRPGNLSYYLAGFNTIDNDADYNRDWYNNNDGSLSQRLPHNAANIVVVPNVGNGFAGFAYFPSASQVTNLLFIRDAYLNTQELVPHEMGHYFNLLHTFSGGDELVNGSNCTTAGDWVCDTPADPFEKPNAGNLNCTYTGTATDANGQAYAPDMKNLMSYWHSRGCSTDHFTPGQLERAYQGYLFRRSSSGSGPDSYDFSAAPNPATVSGLRARAYVANAVVEVVFSGNNSAPTNRVLIERAFSADGPWEVRAMTTGTLWYDNAEDVDINQRYFYRVRFANSDHYSNVAEYVPRKVQTIAFEPLPAQTFGSGPVLLTASSSAGLPVGFQVISGPGYVFNNNQLRITGAGIIQVEALQDGNAEYAPVAVRQAVAVSKAAQVIAVQAVSDKTFGDGPFTVSATSDRGLPVQWQVQSGPGQVSGTTVTITGGGPIRLRAFNDGDPNYLAAEAGLTVNVARANQSLRFEPIADKTFGDAPVVLPASASSGLPVVFWVNGPARVEENRLFITGAGQVTVMARQPGNENYNPTDALEQRFNVAKAAQTVTFSPISNKTFGDAPFDLPASASSGLPLVFTVSGSAQVQGQQLKPTGAGQITVTATQPGNENYLPSNAVSQSFGVARAAQSIALENPADHTYLDPPVDLPARASSGLPVTFSVQGPVSLSEGHLRPTGVGLVTVTAHQPGNENYQPAPDVTCSFAITKGAQVITFEPIPTKTFGDAPFLLPVRLNSTLSLTFIITGSAVFDGTRMRITGTGPVRITAEQPGDDNHLPAVPVTQEFLVEKATQLLTLPGTVLPFGDGTATLRATSSGGLPVQYSVITGPATLIGNTLTFNDYGQVTLRASQPGNENYRATDLTRTFCVNPATPVVTFDPASDVTLLSSSPFRNQWFRNGDTLRGATAPRLTVTQSGDYTVRVSNPVAECNATQVSDAKTVAITALNAPPAEWKLDISPNPSSDYLTVRLTAPGLTAAPVCELVDGLGRVLATRKMGLLTGRYEVGLPVRGLAAGVYLVRVVASGKVAVGRVLVE